VCVHMPGLVQVVVVCVCKVGQNHIFCNFPAKSSVQYIYGSGIYHIFDIFSAKSSLQYI